MVERKTPSADPSADAEHGPGWPEPAPDPKPDTAPRVPPPAATPPAAKRPTAKRPTAKRPAAKRPAAKRPAAKRPAAKRPTSPARRSPAKSARPGARRARAPAPAPAPAPAARRKRGRPNSPIDLSSPHLYNNRELSLLAFNKRVLEQAKNIGTPLLERLRFLTISCTNLDEFFEIRVARLMQQVALGVSAPGPDGAPPSELLDQLSEVAGALIAEQYRVLNEVILPALAAEGVRVLKRTAWTDAQRTWVRDYFAREVEPVLTPIGLDPAHPFPRVLNKLLTFIVSLTGKDAFGRSTRMAVVQAPRCLPRLIRLPAAVADGPNEFVLLSSVIHAHVGELFPRMEVRGCDQFRVTRDSELWVDEEAVDDLLHALQGELRHRNYGDAVRLEVANTCSAEAKAFLLDNLGLEERSLYQVNGLVNLHRLSKLIDLVDRPALKYRPFVPGTPGGLTTGSDLYEVLRQRDVLFHHPFQSFAPILEFVRSAASDPQVQAIKMTVYRTGPDSAVAEALVEAARAGKEVTAVVELRARFDEAANIDLARRLQTAGATVVYGVVGYKTHSKMLLIVRREVDGLRRYVHLGTGNYHPGTTRAYTDFGFMTAKPEYGSDVHDLFQQLTGLGRAPKLNKMLQAPFTLFSTLIDQIEAEAARARAGKKARIMAKMNSLTEVNLIRALYEASQAGVEIDLVVRGICCLRPGVKGVSETIRVRSIIGRFLEHHRVYYFHNGGRPKVWAASADWMARNMHRRIETCFPVEDAKLKKRVVKESFTAYLRDNDQAWLLRADGTYHRAKRAAADKPFRAQERLLQRLAESI